jgi:hypothetical protein
MKTCCSHAHLVAVVSLVVAKLLHARVRHVHLQLIDVRHWPFISESKYVELAFRRGLRAFFPSLVVRYWLRGHKRLGLQVHS